MKQINILHMHPDLAMGGGQVLLLRNIEAMNRHVSGMPGMPRFEHFVCGVRREMTMAEDYRKAGIEVYCLDVAGPMGAARAIARLSALIRTKRIDLVHTNNTYSDRTMGVVAATSAGVPVVNTLHAQPPQVFHPGLRSLPAGSIKQRAWWLARDRVLSRPKAFIAVSENVRAAWAPLLESIGIGGERITAIPPGIRRAEATPADVREMFDPPASHVLLSVGRLVRGKGHEHLIPAMKRILEQHPHAGLVIAGEGPLRADLERLIGEAELTDRVRLLGLRRDVPELLAACDVFLFPTHAEGFGLVALEAMVAGKAVVASDIPVLRALIDQERTGVLVPVAQPEALAGAVSRLLDAAAAREEMGCAARAAIEERYGEAAAAQALARVYMRVLGLPAMEERQVQRSDELETAGTG